MLYCSKESCFGVLAAIDTACAPVSAFFGGWLPLFDALRPVRRGQLCASCSLYVAHAAVGLSCISEVSAEPSRGILRSEPPALRAYRGHPARPMPPYQPSTAVSAPVGRCRTAALLRA